MGRIFDSPVQLLILLLILVLLFGAKRLPDAARGLGRSLRILKTEVKDLKDEDAAQPDTGPRRPEAVEGRVISSETPDPAPERAPSDPRRDA
jgi:sec-independent protein translocase protein TatA